MPSEPNRVPLGRWVVQSVLLSVAALGMAAFADGGLRNPVSALVLLAGAGSLAVAAAGVPALVRLPWRRWWAYPFVILPPVATSVLAAYDVVGIRTPTLDHLMSMAAAALTGPMLCLVMLISGLLLTMPINAFQLMYLTAFRVQNASDEPVWITLRADWGSAGPHEPPQFAFEFPAVPAYRTRDIPVPPGGSRKIVYEWRNAPLLDLLIRNATGQYRRLAVEPGERISDRRYRRSEDIQIPTDLASLPPADDVEPAWTILGWTVPTKWLEWWAIALVCVPASWLLFRLGL